MRRNNLFFSLLLSSVIALVFPSLSFAQGAASVLKQYEGLKGKEREQRLTEGAKKEGRAVVYSFTAVDQLTPLLDEFQKRYPFIKAEHYRANATGVFNKFTTEARAGQTLADVIDISAGETHTLLQMGLIDPYLSPSREGIQRLHGRERILDGPLSFRDRPWSQHATYQTRGSAQELRRTDQPEIEGAPFS